MLNLVWCQSTRAFNSEFTGTHDEFAAVTGTLVTPVVGLHLAGAWFDVTQLHQSPEVASVFTLSLAQLVDPALNTIEFLPSPSAARPGVFAPAFFGGSERVWGLTAFIMMGLLRDILIPAARDVGANLPDLAIAYDKRLPASARVNIEPVDKAVLAKDSALA